MHIHSRSQLRKACVEALEGRRLLSVAGFRVEGVEPAEEEGGTEVEVDPSDLPSRVIDAIAAKYSGAKIVEADFEVDEGVPEYGLELRVRGGEIDLTVTPDGEIIEVEQVVAPGEVPGAVMEQLRRLFPDASVDEVIEVTEGEKVSYEIVFSSGEAVGKQEMLVSVVEGTDDGSALGPTARPLTEEDAATPGETVVHDDKGLVGAAIAASGTSSVIDSTGDGAHLVESTTTAWEEQSESDSEELRDVLGGNPLTPVAGGARILNELFAAAPGLFAAQAIPLTWFPDVYGALTETLPADLASVERELRALLKQIESSVEEAISESPVLGRIVQGAAIVSLVVGLRLLMDARRRKRGPVLAYDPASSSWSWVLGTPPAE